jgi:endonuclease/exonuclease/phosphatase family metal-dependent hydrolase
MASEEQVSTSIMAGKAQQGLCTDNSQSKQQQQHPFPLTSGLVYECQCTMGEMEWAPLPPKQQHEQSLPSSISIMTFNVWFSEYEWKRRADALLDLIKTKNTMVVCLQEVTEQFLTRALADPGIQEMYRLAVSFAPACSYGVAMLMHKQFTSVPTIDIVALSSTMGRTALVAGFLGRLAVATVHLESLDSRPTRTLQLKQLESALEHYDTAILLGDMNITRTGQWASPEENDLLTTHLAWFQDCWLKLHGDTDTEESSHISATFSTDLNPMLRNHSQFVDSARYDRALLKQSTGSAGWDVGFIEIVGNHPFANNEDGNPIFISDHFGLSMALVIPT